MNVSDLTLEMVESYANACRDVHDYCETLRRSGHDLLVVPSRGAHPFIRGAQSFAHRVHSPEGSELPIPGFVRFQSLYLPFTADIDKDQAATSAEIRRYWARVLAAILKGDADNLALRFYQHLRSVAGRLAYGFNAIRSGTSDRFIFLDTVVSGRAIFEIMTAFEECGLVNCHYVLLLHQRGESLEPAYRRAINQMVAIDRATVIPVDSIFTEDEGPAMSGIWTVTMPELMEATKKLVRLSGVGDLVPTLFYCEVRRREDKSNLDITVSNAILSTLLHSAVNDTKDVTSMCLRDFIKRHLSESKVQRMEYTKAIADPLIAANFPVESTVVSSSHVIRAYVGKDEAERMAMKFLETLPSEKLK